MKMLNLHSHEVTDDEKAVIEFWNLTTQDPRGNDYG